MKHSIFIFIALSIFAPQMLIYSADENEMDVLVKSIKPILQGTDWELSTDFCSITLIHRNCKFLNPVSLPTSPDNDQTWKEFSFASDYRITITFDQKLTDAEYIKLWNMQNSLNYEYLKDVTPGTKKYYAAKGEASGRVKLPQYKSQHASIYVYSTRDNFFLVRPKEAQDQEEAIFKLLDKQFTKYDIDVLNNEKFIPLNKEPADPNKIKQDDSDKKKDDSNQTATPNRSTAR